MGYIRHAKEAKTAQGGLTPLHLASQRGHEAVVKRLVHDGADKEFVKAKYVAVNTDQWEMYGE